MKKIYKYLLMTVVASSTMFYSCDTLEMEDLAESKLTVSRFSGC